MKKYTQTSCQYEEIQARLDEYAKNGYRLAAAVPLTFSDYESWQTPQVQGSLVGGAVFINPQPLRWSSLTSVSLIFEKEE